MVTVEGGLSRKPLLTMSCATYVPGRSARKFGEATVVLDKVAALPTGLLVMAHLNVSVSPWGSVPLPLNVTVVPWPTVWFGPAFAVGA
jgi:hypothetical protein